VNVVVVALVCAGLAFSLSGAVGIARMPDLYSRVQCSTKAVTMGALPVLLAIVVARGIGSREASRALVVAILVSVMNAASSHSLVKAAYRRDVPMWPGAVIDQAAEEQREGPRG
jgi:multicomponent Na+:H+ antiporter subunit G